MKVSLNWIKDYVDLPQDMDLTRLAYDLTMSTVEVEGAEDLARRFDHMLVGRIVEVCPHPNADKLQICRTDIGGGDIRDIVCGGTNVRPGMKVAVAAPGAMCRWHGEGEPVEIKEAKLRGVKSYGMICGAAEIGLGDLFPTTEEAHILDLSDFDAAAGTPIADALDLHDIILEIDNKSMTNRPDLWGHYGIARELAALYDLPLKPLPLFTCDAGADGLTVTVEDTERCPRYIGAAVEGLSVKPAPFRMQSRIWRVGMRPINALVDITNYVMLATGQPTHAFDSDNIAGHIIVRRAKDGEQLELLNGKALSLSADDLVIADEAGVVGLAGVMGGAKDSVLPSTDKVILEIANFQAAGVRRTALRYDNRTEASSRYEKAIDPERCDQALSLAMSLFRELYPDVRVTSFCDQYPAKLQPAEIDVSLRWLDRRLGKHLTNDEIAHKLGLLGFRLDFDGDNMHVTVPTWRSTGDVSIKADIMEEVARMVGYENFQAAPITTSFDGAINQLDKDLERRIKEYLAIRCGMQEIFTYPWMDEQYVNAILQDTAGILALSTPPSPTERLIRSSLLPNLCKAVAKNERYFTEFSLFETAQVFKDANYSAPYDPPGAAALPAQEHCRRLRGPGQGRDGPVPPGQGRGGADAPLHPYGGLHLPPGEAPGVGRPGGVAEHLPWRGAGGQPGIACPEARHGLRHQEPGGDAVRAGRGRFEALPLPHQHLHPPAGVSHDRLRHLPAVRQPGEVEPDARRHRPGHPRKRPAPWGRLCGRVPRQAGARREEVRYHPADHRLPGKDPDLHGDRGVRLRRIKKLTKRLGAELRTR